MRRFTLVMLLLTVAGICSADDATKPPAVKEPQLRAELLRRAKADQEARAAITDWMKSLGNPEAADRETFEASLDPAHRSDFKQFADTLQQTDQENTERLAQIVEKHGWPTHTLVGKGGAGAAWLLAQHADAAPKLQRKWLDLMTALPPHEISQKNLAYLTDRVLLAEGKKQLYGTQFTLENGTCKPRPLQDAANVDKRRAKVGLLPLAEYAKQIEAFYGSRSQP